MERYSVFTKPWKTQSVDELIEIIHKMGYNAIEFPLRDGYQVEPANAERDLPKLVARLKDDDIIKELGELELSTMTPIDALNTLYRLQTKLKNRW